MKETTAEIATAGVWGLHISSYLMASLPYLQAISLVLAISVSMVTLWKLLKGSSTKDDEKVI
jgi:hypothetical protein